MFFRSGENEYGMCRRFLQSLEKSIEGGLREHVHLVDDIDAVPAYLRRDTDLIHKGLDVFHSVVGSRIKFMYAMKILLYGKNMVNIMMIIQTAMVAMIYGYGKDIVNN